MNKKDSQKLKEKEFNPNLDKETVKKIMTPMNDFIFKKLFGTVGKEKLIKDFLEAILDIKIETVELGLETILTADEINEKTGVLDVRVKLEDGTDIDVEIQNSENSFIIKRSHFYASRMYGKQLNAGIDYGDLKKVIVIFITNFDVFPKLKEYHTRWLMTEQNNKEESLEEMELHFIEMPKFRKKNPNAETKLEQWLWMIDGREEKVEMAEKQNKEVKKAIETLYNISIDPQERERYESIIQAEFNRKVSEHNFYKEGLEKGRKRGKREGIKEGQKKNKIIIAKKLLNLNMNIEQIREITELTYEEIKEIQKK